MNASACCSGSNAPTTWSILVAFCSNCSAFLFSNSDNCWLFLSAHNVFTARIKSSILNIVNLIRGKYLREPQNRSFACINITAGERPELHQLLQALGYDLVDVPVLVRLQQSVLRKLMDDENDVSSFNIFWHLIIYRSQN